MATTRPRVSGLQVLSRRQFVVGAVALAACDGAPKGGETGSVGADADPIPSITPNEEFYVTSCCGTPEVDGATWTLDLFGATVDLAYLEALAARDREHTLACIGGGPYHLAMSNAVWTGLPLVEILAGLGVEVPEDAVEIVLTGADGYTTALPVADLDAPVWLVWRMNGAPLPPEHGYPARLLVPGRYGMKNPKWIVAMAFATEPYEGGYWERYGWSKEAPYKPNARIHSPDGGARVQAGPVRAQGMAFAGSDPVVRVEVRVDGGAWEQAVLDYAPGADVWALWHYDWEAPAGAHTVQARCVTASGATSGDAEGSAPLEGYDGSMEIEVVGV